MSICMICRGHHHAASCQHRLRESAQRPDTGPAKPLALSEDELNDLAYRSKEGRQFRRSELDRLIAMARERNALVSKPAVPVSAPPINSFGYVTP